MGDSVIRISLSSFVCYKPEFLRYLDCLMIDSVRLTEYRQETDKRNGYISRALQAYMLMHEEIGLNLFG